jgi:leader peptidase (prepilin peptidase)/N-methyltransferase
MGFFQYEQPLRLLLQNVWAVYTMAVLFGLMFGSFVNVMAFRIPQGMTEADDHDTHAHAHAGRWSLLVGRSKCPACEHVIRWHENIPVLSYLWLKGRCAYCQVKISPRYPAIELLVALFAVLTVWYFGVTGEALARFSFCCLLLTLALIDLDHFILPDLLTLPAIWLGLLLNAFEFLAPAREAILGAACGWGSLAAINLAYRVVSGRDGIGRGDWKLAAAIGAWLGFNDMLTALFLGFFVGGVIGMVFLLAFRGDRRLTVPFGPLLVLGGIVEVFLGPGPMDWYLRWVLNGAI